MSASAPPPRAFTQSPGLDASVCDNPNSQAAAASRVCLMASEAHPRRSPFVENR